MTMSVKDGEDWGVPTVGAAGLRAALGVTQYQLGELASGLQVDVGSRANYPAYRRDDVHRMTAVQALRELRTPLEVALKAANDYGRELVAGEGWLLVSPTDGEWGTLFVRTGPDLVGSLRAVGGRGCVLDLDTTATRASRCWQTARNGA